MVVTESVTESILSKARVLKLFLNSKAISTRNFIGNVKCIWAFFLVNFYDFIINVSYEVFHGVCF